MQQGEIPFLRLVVPFCAGIILSGFSGQHWWPGIICCVTAIGGIILSFNLQDKRETYLFGISMSLLLAGTGYILHQTEEKNYSILPETEEVYQIRLKEYPVKKAKSYSFQSSIEASGKELSHHPTGSILVYLSADSIKEKLKPGDRLVVRVTPVPVENRGNPCEFNYVRYLAGHKIRYYVFLKEDRIISYYSPAVRNIKEYSLIAARRLIESFASSGLTGDDLGLVTALTIGEKEYLEREYLTSFSRAGVMHVMAVSGMHVGMISLFLSWILFFMKRKMALARTLIILLSLWSFAFITGLSPSVMRATLMFSFLQAGSLLKRPAASLNLLLASAFILLAARPSVLFEAGFQLSYVAVLFIILFYQPFYSLISVKNRILDYIWQMTAVSVVAQVGTLPLVIRLFNNFPLMFLASNLVIIPLSFLIMILAFILVPFSGIAPVSDAIVWILSSLSHLTLGFTSLVSSWQYGVVTGIGLTGVECVTLTIAAGLLSSSLLRTLRLSLRPFLVSMLLFFLSGIYVDMQESRKESLIIYNIRGKTVPAFQTGRYLTLFYPSDTLPAEVTHHASTRRLRIVRAGTQGNTFTAKNRSFTISATSQGCQLIYGRSRKLLSPGTEIERCTRFKRR